jgi:hypothetical protein
MSELGSYNPNNSEKNPNQPSKIRKIGAGFIAAAALLGVGASMGTDEGDVKIDKSGEVALDRQEALNEKIDKSGEVALDRQEALNEKIDKMFEVAGIQKGSIINVIAAELVINTEEVNVREGYDVSDFNKITSSEQYIGVIGAIQIPLTDDDPNGPRFMAILKGSDGKIRLISFVVGQGGVYDAATGELYNGETTTMRYEGPKDSQATATATAKDGAKRIFVGVAELLAKIRK